VKVEVGWEDNENPILWKDPVNLAIASYVAMFLTGAVMASIRLLFDPINRFILK